jgi:hypothetical protein
MERQLSLSHTKRLFPKTLLLLQTDLLTMKVFG